MRDASGSPATGVRDQRSRGDRAIARSAEGTLVATMVAIFATLGGAWAISYLWGGSKTVGPQLFYAPVLIAATRFGHIGALWVGVIAGVLCGPFLPFDVEQGLEQSVENWVVRLIFFVVIGQVVAALHQRSLPVVQERIAHRQFRQRLATALDAGEIQAVFHPIVDLSTGQIVGVESLARWVTADGEVIQPLDFIPQAEAAGVISSIDLEILRLASGELSSWIDAGYVDPPNFFATVNFSSENFDDEELPQQVKTIITDARIDPSMIVIEVTETALVNDLEHAVSGMIKLKGVGVSLALDDFGVGQSSIAALHRYPVDMVKLDRTFLERQALDRPEVLEAVVHLADGFSHELVVAEGIESVDHLRRVRAAGCRHGQGYLFDRPLNVEQIARALDAGAYHLPAADLVDDVIGEPADSLDTPGFRPGR